MSFANMNHLPRIPSYQEAAFRFNNIKPIRGSENIRPLGNRRSKHYAIQKYDDTYVCTLYGHPVLAFSKDEDGSTIFKINLCGHNTQTTRRFIARILDTSCYSFNKNTYVDVGKNSYYLPNHYTLKIKQGKVLNPMAMTKTVLDRVVTEQLREKYKEQMEGAAVLLSLYNPNSASSDFSLRLKSYRQEYLDDLTHEEVVDYLYCTAMWHTHRNRITSYSTNVDRVRRALYEIAIQDNVQIYKEVDVPIGRRA
jgi:hypothetical protein